jgi:hypothetical protein
MGSELWDLTASIGVAHCTASARVMDIMQSAEGAMRMGIELGGDCVRSGPMVTAPATEIV